MSKIKNIINNFEGYVCTFLLGFTLVILTLQVVSRAFGKSNSWSEELARYCFIWIIFMGAAMAAEKVAHICIDTANYIYPKKIRRYTQILGLILLIAFCGIIIYYSANYAYMLYLSKRISLSLYISMAVPYAAIPVGYTFVTIRLIQRQLIPLLINKKIERTEVDL